MKLLDLLFAKGISLGKTLTFTPAQRTRGGGRAGRFPSLPRRVSPPCQAPVSAPGDCPEKTGKEGGLNGQ